MLCLERWAEKSASNLIASLEESKQVPFERVLYGLGIRYVGETVAKRIASAFHSMEQLEQASFEDLTGVDEIGDRIAQSVIDYFADERNRILVSRLKEYGVQMSVSEEKLANRSEKLKGLVIVISGTFSKHSRDEYKAMIEHMAERTVVPYPVKPIISWLARIWGRLNLKGCQVGREDYK